MRGRCDALARRWGVTGEGSIETHTSMIVLGRRGGQAVALKVVKHPGDEWLSGEILSAFDGHGVARVYEHEDGALLLERLDPGDALVDIVLGGRDEEATAIIADLIAAMAPARSVPGCPTIRDWGRSFGRYAAGDDRLVPPELVSAATHVYDDLAASQRAPRLLHGDLQHYNVLRDRRRGWLAIDPKGVVGEIEYEIGAALRNPVGRPELFADRRVIEKRLGTFASRLGVDAGRALSWAFAQAVLSAIWDVEDGLSALPNHPSLLLANAIRPMLE